MAVAGIVPLLPTTSFSALRGKSKEEDGICFPGRKHGTTNHQSPSRAISVSSYLSSEQMPVGRREIIKATAIVLVLVLVVVLVVFSSPGSRAVSCVHKACYNDQTRILPLLGFLSDCWRFVGDLWELFGVFIKT
jgi:uncharacterized membrane protein YvbJ